MAWGGEGEEGDPRWGSLSNFSIGGKPTLLAVLIFALPTRSDRANILAKTGGATYAHIKCMVIIDQMAWGEGGGATCRVTL